MLAIGRRAGEERCSEVIIARLDIIVTRQPLQKDQVETSEWPFFYDVVGYCYLLSQSHSSLYDCVGVDWERSDW